jgi:hypothetical protein
MTNTETLRKPTMPPAKVPLDVHPTHIDNEVMNKTKTLQHPTNSEATKIDAAQLQKEDFQPLLESLDRVDTQLTHIQDAMLSIEKSGKNLLKLLSEQRVNDESQVPD